jgi:predicted transcriptional regulator
MTSEPYVVKGDEVVRNILKIMFEKTIQRLPVINDNGQLIGLIIQSQILKKLFEFMKN